MEAGVEAGPRRMDCGASVLCNVRLRRDGGRPYKRKERIKNNRRSIGHKCNSNTL